MELWLARIWLILAVSSAFQHLSPSRSIVTSIGPRGAASTGADIEQPPVDDEQSRQPQEPLASAATASLQGLSKGKGKVNEIDFCIAPADASLSRAYGTFGGMTKISISEDSFPAAPLLSLTRALNNASNRAVRRIILAKSWPSAEALNLSLRQVAAAEREASLREAASSGTSAAATPAEGEPKCPVPRPILNVITRKRGEMEGGGGGGRPGKPVPRGRTDQEYVSDQLKSFKDRYGTLPGYQVAEAYLESILSLATLGVESARAQEVLESGVYDDAYRRIKSVLRTAGAVYVKDEKTGRPMIAHKLIDQDICLSMLDKLYMRQDVADAKTPAERSAATTNTKGDETASDDDSSSETPAPNQNVEQSDVTVDEDGVEVFRPRLKFWKKKNQPGGGEVDISKEDESGHTTEGKDENPLSKEDLGGVLLSSEEPTMTRQLNVLSNIVQRALLFGGDQELLVLSETLDADRAAFVDRWYAGSGLVDVEQETRPGVQFLNCLIALLRNCYINGVVSDLLPPLPLSQSYANAYERLVATAVELGSGYLKPEISDVMTMPSPRTAKEELGRFAVWEATFRSTEEDTAHPEDLQGEWEVRDEIGGETIGVSTIRLCEDGQVDLAEPLEGLRWRCDPGPTHLDTCTFQVLSSDGTILQYRGFVDRGARLESRVSKRPIKIRGKVMFQMRDGSVDYFKDMLPINYRQATTAFIMTKIVETV